MTAALGGAGQLTALLCQPAELQEGVSIPPQVCVAVCLWRRVFCVHLEHV
jgi:hypothetical protein